MRVVIRAAIGFFRRRIFGIFRNRADAQHGTLGELWGLFAIFHEA
jgi:hypothetical protein